MRCQERAVRDVLAPFLAAVPGNYLPHPAGR